MGRRSSGAVVDLIWEDASEDTIAGVEISSDETPLVELHSGNCITANRCNVGLGHDEPDVDIAGVLVIDNRCRNSHLLIGN